MDPTQQPDPVYDIGASGFTRKYVVREALNFLQTQSSPLKTLALAGRNPTRLTQFLQWAARPNPPPSSVASSSSLSKRLETIFKKSWELSILCDIKLCVIHYGQDGELKTWPEDRDQVRDIALKYFQLDKATRQKKSIDLYGFLKTKKKIMKKTTKISNKLKYPISDHYSPDQISQLIHSLELHFSALQERLRFVEAKNQKETNFDPPTLTHQDLDQTQSSNKLKYPISDHYSLDQISQLIPSLELNFSILQERLRFVEAKNQKETNFDH